MSDVHVTRRKEGFRAAIDQFLLERLQSKLEKLGPTILSAKKSLRRMRVTHGYSAQPSVSNKSRL